MTEIQLTRRDALKGVAIGAAVGVGSIPLMSRTVLATDSGDPELTINGTVPDGTSLEATIDEYDTSDSTEPINSQTKTLTSSGTTAYGDLESGEDYEYDITIDVNGDGETTPELETPLSFEVPADPEDYEFTNYTTEQEWGEKPEDVEIIYDEHYLRQYQPKLRMKQSTRKIQKGMYGYVAESPDEDTDVLCYWLRIDNLETLPGDSGVHSDLGDHEPIYVFVDSESGNVEKIVYSGYEWGAAEVEPDEDELTEDRTNFPSHATFEIAETWHYYRYAPDANGSFVELKAWPEVRDTWLSNNFAPEAAAVENPWQMLEAENWREESWFSSTDLWIDISQWLGWNGAGEIDDLRE